MREDLLHYIWKYGKFSMGDLRTTADQYLHIADFGRHNKHSGPDFLNARVELDGQLWAGNVEIHLRSSDWYHHGHHRDKAYENVILHVVWEEDGIVFRNSGEALTTLVLKNYVEDGLLGRFNQLFASARKKFINCESYHTEYLNKLYNAWREELFEQRLLDKVNYIKKLFLHYRKDWERLTFALLLRNFGQGVNTASFLSIAEAIDYRIVGRLQGKPFQLESLLMGMAGLLDSLPKGDAYAIAMQQEYAFLRSKYNLVSESIEKPEFMGVRPSGFPTIRLSQFAVFYARSHKIFHKLISIDELSAFYELFDTGTSEYWTTHYNFGRSSRGRKKMISSSLINSIVANTILPLKKFHALEYGRVNSAELPMLARQMKAEDNGVLRNYKMLGFPVRDALDSQSLVYLNKTYCERNRCLECAIGRQILN